MYVDLSISCGHRKVVSERFPTQVYKIQVKEEDNDIVNLRQKTITKT